MSSHVFGPVPSRRLGRSLGVDLVPFKTCTFDCVYCQLGRTTCKTTQRREWVPLNEVLRDVAANLDTEPDFITLSGSGEPPLFSPLNELIFGIKDLTSVPVAVLTNGALLWIPEVRAALAAADLVAPSLDAGDEHLFHRVNRPHSDITFERMVEGLIDFCEAYGGQYWLEVFLLGGITAIPTEVEKIARIAEQIRPDRVQVNTVTRPPAEDFALPVEKPEMEALAAMFGQQAEVITDYRRIHGRPEFAAHKQDVVNLLRRRPCTAQDIAEGLGLHLNEVVKYVDELTAHGVLKTRTRGSALYYSANESGPRPDSTKPRR
jgi:wyosine [tRNA(Phe)-imidazoG37] synthetase (radical SAM superfamily)